MFKHLLRDQPGLGNLICTNNRHLKLIEDRLKQMLKHQISVLSDVGAVIADRCDIEADLSPLSSINGLFNRRRHISARAISTRTRAITKTFSKRVLMGEPAAQTNNWSVGVLRFVEYACKDSVCPDNLNHLSRPLTRYGIPGLKKVRKMLLSRYRVAVVVRVELTERGGCHDRLDQSFLVFALVCRCYDLPS